MVINRFTEAAERWASPMDRNSTRAGRWRRLGLAHTRDKRHIFLILKVKENSLTTHAQKGPLEVKRDSCITDYEVMPLTF